jgi:hypothetical protein
MFKINIGYIVITFVIVILVVLWYKKIESIEASIFNLKNNDKSILNRLVSLELASKNNENEEDNEEQNTEESDVEEEQNNEESDVEEEQNVYDIEDNEEKKIVELDDNEENVCIQNNEVEVCDSQLENADNIEDVNNNIENNLSIEDNEESDNEEEASLLQQYINEENETDASSVKSEEITKTKTRGKTSKRGGRGRKKN